MYHETFVLLNTQLGSDGRIGRRTRHRRKVLGGRRPALTDRLRRVIRTVGTVPAGANGIMLQHDATHFMRPHPAAPFRDGTNEPGDRNRGGRRRTASQFAHLESFGQASQPSRMIAGAARI
jgi:hypothetical protein